MCRVGEKEIREVERMIVDDARLPKFDDFASLKLSTLWFQLQSGKVNICILGAERLETELTIN